MFIPCTILCLRSRLQPDAKNPLTKNELTQFVEEAILILNEELRAEIADKDAALKSKDVELKIRTLKSDYWNEDGE